VEFRQGALGESYEGIGKRVWQLQGRPVLADVKGPFGSPISDSTRSMVTESTTEILVVIYAPMGSEDASVEAAMSRLSERVSQFAGGRVLQATTCRSARHHPVA
jgi:DNA/RNA-binding domain of Phe-tRNA-synthetase-like protein